MDGRRSFESGCWRSPQSDSTWTRAAPHCSVSAAMSLLVARSMPPTPSTSVARTRNSLWLARRGCRSLKIALLSVKARILLLAGSFLPGHGGGPEEQPRQEPEIGIGYVIL